MPASRSIEIDEPEDLARAQALATVSEPAAFPDLSGIKALVMDFDGVHTDNGAWVDLEGHEFVRVDRRDGMGLEMLREGLGLKTLILSKERNSVVAARAGKLGIECLHGVDDKVAKIESWRGEQGLAWEEIAYVGNDVNDLGCIERAGVGIAVADALPEVLSRAQWVLQLPGGQGAVREVCETFLRRA